MKLSIIVVNYNVKYFLQQLLLSIRRSHVCFKYEVIVIDNASIDDSQNYIPNSFSEVHYVYNKKNIGFARANNQGIKLAKGEFILLLNPDTLVQEDTLRLSLEYMEKNEDCGALGVRMIDGSGSYLPESKRGFPTPVVAFFKSFGLASLFPSSPIFNRYYLGHLPEYQINEVDVLTGAFMLLRRKVLDLTGLLDEKFFMYGEDIDLSFRVKSAGYKVIYFPETSIIHFKGESTKKDSLTYIRSFYGAMILFAEKHYSGQKALLLRIVLRAAIYFKAIFNVVAGVFRRYGLMLFEGMIIAVSLLKFSSIWAGFYFSDANYYAASAMELNVAIYAGIWIVALFLAGAYDDRYRWMKLLQGWLVGWIAVAILYAFFDSDLRPSRFIVLSAGPIVLLLLALIRASLHKLKTRKWPFFGTGQRRFAIVGNDSEAKQVLDLLKLNHPALEFVGRVTPNQNLNNSIGHLDELDQIAQFHRLDELFFCSKDVTAGQIMRWMTRLGPDYLYKIAPDQTLTIIGSQSKDRPGEWFTFDVKYQINSKTSRRNKRLLDLIISLIFIPLVPILCLIMRNKKTFITNLLTVLGGSKTWVSYTSSNIDATFPPLKSGVLTPLYGVMSDEHKDRVRSADFFYARDYTIWKDVSLILNKLSDLGG